MATIPDVLYARSGDVAIAYQVVGEGPVDLVFVPFFGNVRWAWELPLFARFLERLASFSRLILFDKRGTGLSDRPRVLTLETQMDDIRAVMEAVGSERAALLGGAQGGPGQVVVSGTVRDLVAGSGIEFEALRRTRAQGRSGRVEALRGP
jgi:pimeloyl-ACP methyl ester carboxylesterase